MNQLRIFLSPNSGSAHQFVSVLNQSGDILSTIKYYDGFMGQRIGSVTSLAFHPYKVSFMYYNPLLINQNFVPNKVDSKVMNVSINRRTRMSSKHFLLKLLITMQNPKTNVDIFCLIILLT